MTLDLPARLPFSLRAVARSHGWFSLAPYGWDDSTGELSYVGRLGSSRVVEIVIQENASGVRVRVDDSLSEPEWSEIAIHVAWMLDLDQDFSTFYDLARKEPKLAHLEERAQGRILRSPTLFEDGVKTILTTNTSWAGTIRMVAALVSQYGVPLSSDPSRHTFPSPDELAATNEQTLRSEARLGYRAPFVLELARSVATGTLDLESLRNPSIPTAELRKRLLAIKGIGEYATASLLMLLGRYDFVPVDSWALKMVSHEWYDGRPVGRGEVEQAFEQWGEWKGLAYWFWDWSYVDQA
jgi:3-methyladenine DNA glycosylase/8-oxoguanine DNA glycosylase